MQNQGKQLCTQNCIAYDEASRMPPLNTKKESELLGIGEMRWVRETNYPRSTLNTGHDLAAVMYKEPHL